MVNIAQIHQYFLLYFTPLIYIPFYNIIIGISFDFFYLMYAIIKSLGTILKIWSCLTKSSGIS